MAQKTKIKFPKKIINHYINQLRKKIKNSVKFIPADLNLKIGFQQDIKKFLVQCQVNGCDAPYEDYKDRGNEIRYYCKKHRYRA